MSADVRYGRPHNGFKSHCHRHGNPLSRGGFSVSEGGRGAFLVRVSEGEELEARGSSDLMIAIWVNPAVTAKAPASSGTRRRSFFAVVAPKPKPPPHDFNKFMI